MSTAQRKRKQSAKKREEGSEDEPVAKRNKGCDRRLCQDIYHDPPHCFCKATDKLAGMPLRSACVSGVCVCVCRCAGGGHTSRWYHLSAGQHYCNECFEYFYRRFEVFVMKILDHM